MRPPLCSSQPRPVLRSPPPPSAHPYSAARSIKPQPVDRYAELEELLRPRAEIASYLQEGAKDFMLTAKNKHDVCRTPVQPVPHSTTAPHATRPLVHNLCTPT